MEETYRVYITPSARKEAKKLPKQVREAALEASRTLEREPRVDQPQSFTARSPAHLQRDGRAKGISLPTLQRLLGTTTCLLALVPTVGEIRIQGQGVAGCIQKPYRPMKLIEKVREVLGQTDRVRRSQRNA